MRKPFPHQEQGADFAVDRNGACLWMKMRTGKTLTALLAIQRLGAYPTLIVCPKSIISVWVSELLIAGCSMDQIRIFEGSNAKRTALIHKQVKNPVAFCICNYEAIQPFRIFHCYPWQAIILDESLRVANISAKRTRYILDYVQEKRFPTGQARFCLSGSPASEGPFQLVPQMYFVLENFMGYKDWEIYVRENWKYNDRIFKWMPIRGKAHVAEVRKWSEENSFQCDLGIGDSILRRKISYEPSPWQVEMLATIRKALQYTDKNGKVQPYIPIVKSTHELQVCLGLDPFTKKMMDTRKIEAILDWHLDTGEPCVVFSRYRTGVQEAFEEIAKAKKVVYGVMVGSAAEGENERVKEAFVSGRIQVLFGQIVVIKEGLNLSRASTIHGLSNSYSYNDREQVELRCSQMGKTEPTEVIDHVIPGWLDDNVVSILEGKQDVSASFVKKWEESDIVVNASISQQPVG